METTNEKTDPRGVPLPGTPTGGTRRSREEYELFATPTRSGKKAKQSNAVIVSSPPNSPADDTDTRGADDDY